jgi:hypothetical protein
MHGLTSRTLSEVGKLVALLIVLLYSKDDSMFGVAWEAASFFPRMTTEALEISLCGKGE